ncbi:hypothetical protein BD410DRAFT_808299 [Rickenella mellea]|uniref:Protein kinase domain-containing protein n=1 Tax=Rickenella mellea TaxID=50990 RepID=A0A4Y7PMG0_9AGAM|nr:hypothetical protein BD410DRAFT_808299 [Rickenella mellea]
MGIGQPWSQQAEAEAEALRHLGTPKNTQYSTLMSFRKNDLVGWEQFCYKRMEFDYLTEVEAYQRLQLFQGRHIPMFYGEAKLITTDVTRAIIPRAILIEYIPDAIPLHNMNKDSISLTLAKSFLEILKEFHARGVVHNDLNYGNILVCRSENGQARAFIIDFEHPCLRESNSDAEWADIVHQLGDTRFMLGLLQESLGIEDVSSFIGEAIDINS